MNPESDDRVGCGPTYTAIRAEAAKLVPLFIGGGGGVDPRSRWSVGLTLDVEPGKGGHVVSLIYPIVSRWRKSPPPRGNSLETVASIEEIRATGIALMAYAEAIEAAQEDSP